MKLLLINISLRPESIRSRMFPIGLGYIATALDNAGIYFDLLDIDLDRPTPQELKERLGGYDVYAFGCIVTGYKIVKELAKMIREINKDALIILGNTVGSSIPEIIYKNTEIDYIIMGEGDITIVELMKSRHHWAVEGIYGGFPRPIIKDISILPHINWSLFNIKSYIEKNKWCIPEPYPIPFEELRVMPVNSARGCTNKCTFCYHAFYGCPYRYRSVKSLSEEMDYLQETYEINYINFYDDLTIHSKKRAYEFIEIFKGRNMYWTACCRADLITKDDYKLAEDLRDVGCVSLGYSLESANAEILKAMNKHISLAGYSEMKKVLDGVGIATVSSLVLGYPQETEDTLKETFDYCYDNEIFPSTGYLLPQPGSPMYQYALDNSFIKDEEEYLLKMGDRQDLRLNMSQIPSDRFEQLVHNHLKRIRDKMKLNLNDDQLLKTGVVKAR